MEIKITLSTTEHKDLLSYCNLNDLLISSVVRDSFNTGFNIQKYGLLNSNENVVEKIVEVPIEIIKYVDREVITEVKVEVPVEKIITKTEYVNDDTQTKELLLKIKQLEERNPEVIEKVVGDETKTRMLEQTLQILRTENLNKDKKIKELEDIVSNCKKYEQKTGAIYLRGTNLDETLYK
jgi:phosphomevalonate kinase